MHTHTPLLFALLLTAAASAQNQGELAAADLSQAEQDLHQVLAAPREEAFRQVLTEVVIRRDPLYDTTFVYDLIVRYDPKRYRNPRVGIYPLAFEDQFIHWGRRIGLYTLTTSWRSGRFYLHDISTAREAWIFTEDARRLYEPPVEKVPAARAQWMALAHATAPTTSIRSTNRWLFLMHNESRELVIRRLQAEKQREATLIKKEPR